MDVELRAETVAASVSTLLSDGWVYSLNGSTVTTLHSNGSGKVLRLKAGGEPTHPWEYTEKFVVAVGTALNVYFSRGKTPIPGKLLSALTAAFETVTVPPPSPMAATVSPTGINTLAIAPESRLSLTDHTLQWTTPELDILPLTFIAPPAGYETDSLLQGASLWVGTTLQVRERGTAPAPSAAVKLRERAQVLAGTVDAAATGVSVSVLDRTGTAIPLLVDGTATTPVNQVNATLGAASGSARPFQVNLLFQNPAAILGAVQVVAQVSGLPKPTLEAAFFLLVGVQAALVDDQETNTDGKTAGPTRGEADDAIVVDFLISPQQAASGALTSAEAAALAAAQVGLSTTAAKQLAKSTKDAKMAAAKASNIIDLGAQTRARRMVRYQIRSRPRQLNPAQPTLVQTPEMPFWMGELQLLGMTQAATEDLLQRQKHALPPPPPPPPPPPSPSPSATPAPAGATAPPTQFNLSFTWTVTLNWDGPNSASTTRPFTYSEPFTQSVALKLSLDSTDHIAGVSAGSMPGALTPAPVAMTFPVAGRRLPRALLDVQRPWGRQAGATTAKGLVVEFQPQIISGGIEVMRGGDGVLSLTALTLNGSALKPGLDPRGSAFAAPASNAITVPAFRVIGTTPPRADIDTLIDELVSEFFTANATIARINFLPLATWQVTTRRIVFIESARTMQAFDNRGSQRRTFLAPAFGNEADMPMFGAPAGYTLGQLDLPPVTTNQMWSFLEGLRASVRLIMGPKASAAFALVLPHIGAVPTALAQAAYRREIVRRYNGGTEIQFVGGTFVLVPNVSAAIFVPYPNTVLGTNVAYTGIGKQVPFPATEFGP